MEPVVVSENISFIEYLYFTFSSYPDIEKLFPPGVLGFTINEKQPGDFTTLNEGDVIYFFIVTKSLIGLH
jgi:hypothetical protein